jgi:hypothetical protein
MFTKGSRYFNIPQSRHLTSAGEWLLSSDLRFIPPVGGQFLHSVKSRDRLDLLAFQYYNDPLKWWLIADANPDQPFPLDMLDSSPTAEEVLTIQHPEYLRRVALLMVALQSFGAVLQGLTDLWLGRVRIEYAPATVRALITDEIARGGFHLIDSFAWPGATGTVEAFMFEDPQVKKSWNELAAALSVLPGMLEVQSVSAGAVLRVRYVETQLSRMVIEGQIESRGFEIVPASSYRTDRLSARITIPPNQA